MSLRRGLVLVAALAGMTLAELYVSAGESTARGRVASVGPRLLRSPARTACGLATRRVRKGGHTRTVQSRACVRLATFVSFSATVQRSTGTSGDWPAVPQVSVAGDDEPPLRLGGGPLRLLAGGHRPVTIAGMTASAASGPAHAAAGGVQLRAIDLAANPSPAGVAQSGLNLADMATAGETSVAMSGPVVMFTANSLLHPTATPRAAAGGAAYSVDGGATFTELDTGSVFNTPPAATSSCAPYCDQVVTYDSYAKMFVWGRPAVYHVTMYVGHGMMIESPNSAASVWVTPLRTADFYGARRYAAPG